MKASVRYLLFVFVLAVLILATAPRVTKAATAVLCGADPSTAVLGTKITITCTGFDPNTIVNSYTVDSTGFAEFGHDDYSACVMNGQGGSGASAGQGRGRSPAGTPSSRRSSASRSTTRLAGRGSAPSRSSACTASAGRWAGRSSTEAA